LATVELFPRQRKLGTVEFTHVVARWVELLHAVLVGFFAQRCIYSFNSRGEWRVVAFMKLQAAAIATVKQLIQGGYDREAKDDGTARRLRVHLRVGDLDIFLCANALVHLLVAQGTRLPTCFESCVNSWSTTHMQWIWEASHNYLLRNPFNLDFC
jgi:hypothetical protein